MTDYFALLDHPRSAALDAAALKAKFHERARSEHPDAGGATFQQLNAAYRTLADPKSRLAHLLELNGASRLPITEPPPDLIELFFETAKALKGSKPLIDEQLTRLTVFRQRIVDSLATLDLNDNRQLADAHRQLAFLDRWIAQLNDARS